MIRISLKIFLGIVYIIYLSQIILAQIYQQNSIETSWHRPK